MIGLKGYIVISIGFGSSRFRHAARFAAIIARELKERVELGHVRRREDRLLLSNSFIEENKKISRMWTNLCVNGVPSSCSNDEFVVC